MYRYQLKDIFLGEPDGKKEALYHDNFEHYFYDYQNISEAADNPKNFLILGRKGSGKTILAEYLKKKSINESCNFCEIRSYKDFKFQELIHFKAKDIRPNEYIPFWEWVILLDIARMTLKDLGIENSENRRKLEKFYKDNYTSIDIDSKDLIEITKQNKINASAFHVGASYQIESKLSTGIYLNYLDDLREVVIGILRTSKSKYTIYYDELDDRFHDEINYKDGIVSLIKAADKLNLLFLENRLKTKVCILLRSDIFSLLNDPDLNKIKMGNSILLDWGNASKMESPLFDLVLAKIQKSIPELSNLNREEMFKLFFPQDIRDIPPARFLLERTFFRPRDIITYLKLVIKKYPNTQYFGWKAFIDTKDEYSGYFFQEVRNELSGHLSDIEIDESTLLLKQFNRYHFSYKEIVDYFTKNHPLYRNIDLDKTLRIFFKFSIIGNRWLPPHHDINYYSWAYRDNRAEIDFDKTFVVHLGLREELSL